ncbi:methylenetetrahydrofolate reductase [NAD(P)H] [Clostridium sp. 'White wine YQ']|uniref:methylenetetrahydrofolate reductase [NAD(P)H] n=1 Tax=Clostridium sp. 'White wine YQ' TaxID=3027474 RepID=UPI0023673B1E|nr:methylenetetrahydrofolate reductase [NAD(P)H] [Clostridium sp. 'White wine YQ']MDD7793017.1 methylenetetrahydrofolate reductase [NAD(P)H] [Clostridium sp. 'White wine YQ']
MFIKDIFESRKVVYSFEIFPPKTTSSLETIYTTLENLGELKPDFISVTYGAGGSTVDNKTTQLSSLIKNKYGIEALAHLTCIGSTKEDINNILNDLKKNNINNILALRGDIPIGQTNNGEFSYAYELVNHIKDQGDFGVSAACYPEGHIECRNLELDIERLKQKVDNGAEHLVSQLFFNNEIFYNFLDRADKEGINVPIEAGIMPVVNKKQIERISSLCGAQLPAKFLRMMDKYEHNPEALRDAGIAYAVEQIVDLLSSGVRGIHLYTMNNPLVARRITENIGTIITTLNEKAVI